MVRIMCAIPGAGKSTFIKQHKKENDFVICPDEIRKELTGNISDQSKNKEVWELAYSRLREALLNLEDPYQDIWFDATSCKESSINKILKVVEEACKKTKASQSIQFECLKDSRSPEICKARIAADLSNGVDRSKVPDNIVDNMYANFLELNLEKIKERILDEDWVTDCYIEEH